MDTALYEKGRFHFPKEEAPLHQRRLALGAPNNLAFKKFGGARTVVRAFKFQSIATPPTHK
jgi:hypothetical protein